MINTLVNLHEHIENASAFSILHKSLEKHTKNVLPIDEVLRAQIVFVVSAFDYFIHEIIRHSILQLFFKSYTSSVIFKNINIPLNTVKEILHNEEDQYELLNQEIYRLNSYKSFQSPENISQALSVIGIKDIWPTIGSYMDVDKETAKKKLRLIVQKRNCIAHQSDMDTIFNQKNPISTANTEESTIFIIQLSNVIFEIVNCHVKSLTKI